MKETYLAVAGRIRRELEQVERVVDRAQTIWNQAKSAANDYHIDAVAFNLKPSNLQPASFRAPPVHPESWSVQPPRTTTVHAKRKEIIIVVPVCL